MSQLPPPYEGDGTYVFVSYAHDDADAVYSEIGWLQDQGVNVWYDTGIHAGNDWSEELAHRIMGCDRFLMFITPRFVASENCRRELNFALAEERPLLAVHLEQTVLPPGIRLSLDNRQAILKQNVGLTGYRDALIDALEAPQGTALGEPHELRSAPVALGPQPLVGRRDTLGRLVRALNDSMSGAGRVSFLAGEPGIGKTRTAEEVVNLASSQGVSVYIGRCDESLAAPPYWPWIRILRAIAADQQDTDWRDAVAPDAALLRIIVPELEGYFADLPDAPELDANRLLFELAQGISSVLKRLAARRPLLLWLDDLHRADKQSLQVLAAIAGDLSVERIFMIATYRAAEVERGSPLAGLMAELARLSHFERLELAGLNVDEVREVLQQYTDDPDPRLVELVAAKTDGNPLYVTLLAKGLTAESIVSGVESDYVLPDSVREVVLGATVKLSPEAQTVVEIASVMGREFDPRVVELVSGLDSDVVDRAIAESHKLGVLALTRERVVRFEHVLIRDAVYGELGRSRRTALHRSVADTLESATLAQSTQPEFLAHHLSEAGEIDRAIPYWQESGERAAQRAAPGDAAEFFRNALDLLARLPEDRERHRRELALRGFYGLSLSASAGYALPEVEATQRRALELCELLEDAEARYMVLRRLCTFYIVRNELGKARELANQCITGGEAAQRADYLIEGYNALGYVQAFSGALDAACRSLEQAITLYKTENGDELSYPTEQNPAVAALALLGIVLAICGDFNRAKTSAREAVAIADRLERPFDLAYAEIYYSVVEHLLGREGEAERHGRSCAELGSEHGFALWQCLGTFCAVMPATTPATAEASVPTLRDMLATYEAAGARTFLTYYRGCLAEVYVVAGRLDEARTVLDAAFASIDAADERFYEAALYRIRGALRAANRQSAEADLVRAKELAGRQGAKLFQLEALTALCALNSSYAGELHELCADFDARGEGAPKLDAAAALLAEV